MFKYLRLNITFGCGSRQFLFGTICAHFYSKYMSVSFFCSAVMWLLSMNEHQTLLQCINSPRVPTQLEFSINSSIPYIVIDQLANFSAFWLTQIHNMVCGALDILQIYTVQLAIVNDGWMACIFQFNYNFIKFIDAKTNWLKWYWFWVKILKRTHTPLVTDEAHTPSNQKRTIFFFSIRLPTALRSKHKSIVLFFVICLSFRLCSRVGYVCVR